MSGISNTPSLPEKGLVVGPFWAGRIPLDPDAHGNPHFEVTYVKILG